MFARSLLYQNFPDIFPFKSKFNQSINPFFLSTKGGSLQFVKNETNSLYLENHKSVNRVKKKSKKRKYDVLVLLDERIIARFRGIDRDDFDNR